MRLDTSACQAITESIATAMISSLTMAEFHQLRELDGGLRLRQAEAVFKRQMNGYAYLDDPEYMRLDSELNSRKILIAKIFVEVDDVLATKFNSTCLI